MVEGQYRAGLPGTPCVFRVVHHSGTIRKSEEKIIQMARSEIFLMRKAGEEVADGVLLALGGGREGLEQGNATMIDADRDESKGDSQEDEMDMLDAE